MTVRDWRLGEMPADRLAKLPKFAQDEITYLRHQLGYSEALVTELTSEISEDDTNVIIDEHGASRRGLPKDTNVKFDLAPKIGTWGWQREVAVRLSDRFKSADSRLL